MRTPGFLEITLPLGPEAAWALAGPARAPPVWTSQAPARVLTALRPWWPRALLWGDDGRGLSSLLPALGATALTSKN